MDRTPAAWLDLLERRLDERWAKMSVFEAYYRGDQQLAFVTEKFRSAFGSMFADLTDNYMQLVVDAPSERLRVQGFRYGDDADKDAWTIWQANGLDAQSNMVHTESIKLGESYWLVEPPALGSRMPRITAEHPSQMIVAYAAGNRRQRLAALKRWSDEDGKSYATLYLPDRVLKYESGNSIAFGARLWAGLNRRSVSGAISNWQSRAGSGRNPLGVVPVVPMPNNPSMLDGGRSDLDGGPISLQDAITKTLADSLVGSESRALPQRVLLGVEAPRDPITGEVISDLESMNSKLWYFNSENAKAHEFSPADLETFRNSMDGLIGDLAAQTRIPIYYFRPQAISNISAEALIGLDVGLVSKTNDKKDPFGEGHEEMMALAFRSISESDPRGLITDSETIWKDTESRSEAQRTDAVVKLVSIGLPLEIALEKLGFSPQEVVRIIQIKQAEALLAPNGSADALPAPVAPNLPI